MRLRDIDTFFKLVADEGVDPDAMLSAQELIGLDRSFHASIVEAIEDPATPCEHNGTRWANTGGGERCGTCGRRVEEKVNG